MCGDGIGTGASTRGKKYSYAARMMQRYYKEVKEKIQTWY